MIKSLMIFVSFVAMMQKGCGQVSKLDTNINKSVKCTNCTPKDSAISKKLASMNFDSYQGKEVAVFLDDLGYKYDRYVPHMNKPGYIWKIIFRYTDSLSVDIRVSDLNQTEKLNFGYTFDIEEFKKKKISMICFRYAGQCIKGCKGELCYD
jgi:hypothetical protein